MKNKANKQRGKKKTVVKMIEKMSGFTTMIPRP